MQSEAIHEVFEDEVTATPAVALAQLQRAVRVSRTSKSREEVGSDTAGEMGHGTRGIHQRI